jgi:ribonucleoside-diphosphate reductase alpha chain
VLSSLGKKIFIDRYALKEYDNFAEGDMVLVHQSGESGCTTAFKGQSTFGTVLSFSDDIILVKLSSDETISCEKSNVAKPIETPEMMFKRVAIAVVEAEENKARWEAEFLSLLENYKFIPGGRILSAAGNENLTFYNCFVLIASFLATAKRL